MFKQRWLLVLLILMLSVPLMVSAQEDDELEAIEAEINALAIALHSLDTRDPAATSWVGGNIGFDNLRADVEPGTQFDSVMLQTFDGDEVDILDNDAPIIINFWASWCGPCVHEFPFAVEYTDTQLQNTDLIFVNVSDERDNALEFLDSREEDIESLIDVDNQFSETSLGLAGLPTTVLLDADGTVLVVHTGSLMPDLLKFMDLIAKYPELGSFDANEVGEPEEIANLDGIDLDEAQALGFDEPATNYLDQSNWYDIYAYEATEGNHVDIIMVGLEDDNPYFDPYLVILDENGERIAEMNDSRLPPASMIDITFEADGTYYIVATRLLERNSIFGGEYGLLIADGDTVQ